MPLSEADTVRMTLFQDMTPAERQTVLDLLVEEQYPRGETILREGKSIQILWIIASGRCEVIKTTRHGVEQQLAVLEPGAVFGEMSFFNPAPHSASVRAQTDVTVMRLSREKFDKLQGNAAAAAFKLGVNTARVLAQRLRKMDDWVCELFDRPDGVKHREEWHDFRQKLYSDWQF